MIDAKNKADCSRVAGMVADICALARRAAEAEMRQGTQIDFSNLLEQCEAVEGFFEAGCLDFGLDIMADILRGLMNDFLHCAEVVCEHPLGLRNEQAKNDLGLSLKRCYDALGMDQPRIH